MEPAKIFKKDLIYPELSYVIVGCAFDVFNQLGPGHSEKVYHSAFAETLRMKNIRFSEQVYYTAYFNSKPIGKSFLDFEIENLLIIELKKDEHFSKVHIDQVIDYIKKSNLKLAIIINFTKDGVKYKRLVNISEST